jgi:sugar phosphate isomerase/epimerase
MDDPVLMRATLAALQDTGLRVHDIEFVRITPDLDPATLAPLLDTGAALGARHLICAPYDPDLPRLSARVALITEMAKERGLGTVLEFFPWTPVPDLAAALRATEGTGARVLVDALHFDRSGSPLDLLRATDPARLPFAHLCDAPVHPPYTTEDLLHAARAERLPPGEGQIDLAGWLAALPDDCPLAVEIPMTALTRQVGPDEVLRRLAGIARRFAGAAGRAGQTAPQG